VSGAYDEYEIVADLYDHVAVYRERPDVAFFVEEHVYAGYDKSPFGSQYPGELLFVVRKDRRMDR
jgi:hypothetical protein